MAVAEEAVVVGSVLAVVARMVVVVVVVGEVVMEVLTLVCTSRSSQTWT